MNKKQEKYWLIKALVKFIKIFESCKTYKQFETAYEFWDKFYYKWKNKIEQKYGLNIFIEEILNAKYKAFKNVIGE